MKKNTFKLDKAFSLDKETIAKLNDAQMSALAGGKGAQDEAGYNSCVGGSCNTSKVPTTIE